MSLFDILENGDFGAALNTIVNQAKNVTGNIAQNTPGGMGGILGAGTLGAVLGNLLGGNAVKGVALAGASAVAWNFYKKWAEAQKQESSDPVSIQASSRASGFQTPVDPTSLLIVRAMNYAARADGKIDADEMQRMNDVLKQVLPNANVADVIETVSQETIDPARIARDVMSPDQAEDIYRLSCTTIDIDQFMERNYLDALANALNISPAGQKQMEAEAESAKRQLRAALAS